jgi:hypothetical protein
MEFSASEIFLSDEDRLPTSNTPPFYSNIVNGPAWVSGFSDASIGTGATAWSSHMLLVFLYFYNIYPTKGICA